MARAVVRARAAVARVEVDWAAAERVGEGRVGGRFATKAEENTCTAGSVRRVAMPWVAVRLAVAKAAVRAVVQCTGVAVCLCESSVSTFCRGPKAKLGKLPLVTLTPKLHGPTRSPPADGCNRMRKTSGTKRKAGSRETLIHTLSLTTPLLRAVFAFISRAVSTALLVASLTACAIFSSLMEVNSCADSLVASSRTGVLSLAPK